MSSPSRYVYSWKWFWLERYIYLNPLFVKGSPGITFIYEGYAKSNSSLKGSCPNSQTSKSNFFSGINNALSLSYNYEKIEKNNIHNINPVHNSNNDRNNNKDFSFEEDDWIIGFDTSHLDDSEINWPKDAVISHTKELASFFEKEENFI